MITSIVRPAEPADSLAHSPVREGVIVGALAAGAVAMAGDLWYRHPALRHSLEETSLGDEVSGPGPAAELTTPRSGAT